MEPALDAVRQYYAVFSSLNMPAIVACFSEPCMSIAPAGVFTAANREDLAKAFTPIVEGLRAKGYGRSEFIEPEVTEMGNSSALVRGTAVRYSAAGPEIERLRIAYLMHRTEAGWKIAAIVFMN